MGEFEKGLELSEDNAREAGITNWADLIRFHRTGELTPDAEMTQRQRERDQAKHIREARLRLADATHEAEQSRADAKDPEHLREVYGRMVKGVVSPLTEGQAIDDETAHRVLLAADEWHDLVDHFRNGNQLGKPLEETVDAATSQLEDRLRQPGLTDAATADLMDADFQIIDGAKRRLDGLSQELRRRPLEFQVGLLDRPGKFGDQAVDALIKSGPGKNQLGPEATATFANTVLDPLLARIDRKINSRVIENNDRETLSGPINSAKDELQLLREIVDSVLDSPEARSQAQAGGFDRTELGSRVTQMLLDAPGDFNHHETAQNAIVLIDKLNRPEGYEDPAIDATQVEEFLSRIYHNLVLPYSSPGYAHKPYAEINQAIRNLFLDRENIEKGERLPR